MSIDRFLSGVVGSGEAVVVETGRYTGLDSTIDGQTWQRVRVSFLVAGEIVTAQTVVRAHEASAGTVTVTERRGPLGYTWYGIGRAGEPADFLLTW